MSVTDYSAPDVNATAGSFRLDGLYLGRYTVRETAAPEGYALDPDTETVDLTIAGRSGSVGPAFVDPALFKVLVITCNTTTERLVDSTVDLNGSQQETVKPGQLPAGVTEQALCGLPGATYDNLTRGDYSVNVELPDRAPLFP